MGERKKLGVVLFQLGGPDSLEAVRPFLYNLFCDPDIIELSLGRFGALPQKALAKYIVWRRAPHVREAYARIGGRSPIRLLTERQARALEKALRPHFDVKVVVAMRYWRPFTSQAIRELEVFAPDELVLLPLYPQYSRATTGSSLHEWERCLASGPLGNLPAGIIRDFRVHPDYIGAVVERINLSLVHFRGSAQPHLIFSAHGLPVSLIARGDPYQEQIEETVRRVMQEGSWKIPHALCYQSKVGRREWLGPSLIATLESLATQGVRQILVVPISFVTEHIETLDEINHEAREIALRAGVEKFEMMPALGDSPRFISALADLVLQAAATRPSVTSAKA